MSAITGRLRTPATQAFVGCITQRLAHPLAVVSALTIAAPAVAVPPPPPPGDVLDVAQTFITAMRAKNAATYGSLLAPGFAGYEAGRSSALTRGQWLARTKVAFSDPNLSIAVLNAFSGGRDVGGRYAQRVLLVEKLSSSATRKGIPGDCYALYRTETIVVEGGRIVRIDRSPVLDTPVSIDGKRTDIP